MPAHNNVIPNQHFHKRWMDRVKTWFNQPARKHRRRMARKAKAAKIAPRPTGGLLRPVVHPPTVRYNMKVRKGRGFTFEELKEAGIDKRMARHIGIAVDHRRKNHSVESLQDNVQRLKTYTSKLVVFTEKSVRGLEVAKEKKSEAAGSAQHLGEPLPVPKVAPELQFRAVEDKEDSVYHQLRVIRSDTRLEGLRLKRQREKEEANK